MPLDVWIAHYGYAATWLGGAFESETVVLLAGLAAHRSLLDLHGVIGAATLGMFSANQALFHAGRLHGHALLARWPRLQPRAARVLELAHRHQYTLVMLYHFAVGVRAMTPFVLGMSRVRPLRFALLDGGITLGWVSALAVLGYWLGDALERWMPELHRVQHLVIAALAGLGALGWFVRRQWTRRRRAEG
jgi:membrane protein DedA with SNARE-associated domain